MCIHHLPSFSYVFSSVETAKLQRLKLNAKIAGRLWKFMEICQMNSNIQMKKILRTKSRIRVLQV